MNERMNFDTSIVVKRTMEAVPFEFKIEHALSPHHLTAVVRDADTNEIYRTYKVICYLYGRLYVGSDSYFAEICGYVDTENKLIVTHHIVTIDPLFNNKYAIDYSESAICATDFFEFL